MKNHKSKHTIELSGDIQTTNCILSRENSDNPGAKKTDYFNPMRIAGMMLLSTIYILFGISTVSAQGSFKYVSKWGNASSGPGQFNLPKAIAETTIDSPRELLEKMTHTYSSCKSYKDKGVVTTVFFRGDGGKRTVKKPFTTAFVRPDSFRFEFKSRRGEEEWNRYIIYRDGESVRTWWSVRPGIENKESLARAIAGATGVYSSSAHTIPRLLLPYEVTGNSLAKLTDIELLGDEDVAGVPCFKIQGKYSRDRIRTLWVDKSSFLIRKIFGSSKFPDFRTEKTTTYDPQLNIDIGPDDLKFDPPADAKLLEAEPATPQRPKFDIPAENLKIPDEVQTCTENFQKIYAAIKKYETDKGTLPDWLSDLAPKYLSKEDLLSPAHPDRTKARYSPDPNLPCNYEYEFSPTRNRISSGRAFRDWKEQQVREFGDVVPIVRCLYHGSGTEMALNISVGGQIYWSPWGWEAMFAHSSRSVPEEQSPLAGKTAPSFTLKDLNGKQVSLSDFKGKVVLLDFWATWCGPCRRAIPHLEALHKKYKDQGLVVIGINHERDHDKVRKFAEEQISYVVVLDADEQFKEYGIRGIPTAFYIDREGKIRYREIGFGPGREKEVEQKVRELLAVKEDVSNKSAEAVRHYNRGVNYAKYGRYVEAVDSYIKAVELKPDYADAYFNLGYAYYNLKHYDESIEAYRQVFKILPNDFETYRNFGQTYIASHRYEEAAEASQKAISLKPDYADAYFNLGISYYYLKRFEEAVEAYKSVLKILPNDAETHLKLAQAYVAFGQIEESIKSFKKAIDLNADTHDTRVANTYTNLGVDYGQLGRLDEAIESFKQAISLKPGLAMAHNNLAFTYSKLGRFEEAIESYKTAIKIKPDYAEAYSDLGAVYGKVGLHDKEIETYKQAISLKPDFVGAYINLGATYGELGRNVEAIEAYNHVVRLKPDEAKAYLNLGAIYYELGRYQESINACKEAIRINPDDSRVHMNLGLVYTSLRRYQESINACKEAIRINPDDSGTQKNLGASYLALGRFEEAIEAFQKAISLKPDDAEVHGILGFAYYKLGRFEESIEPFKKAVTLLPDFPKYHANLGIAYASLGRFEESIEHYKKAVTLLPNFPEYHADLGRAYIKLGDKESALKEYEILKTLDKNRANELLKIINKDK